MAGGEGGPTAAPPKSKPTRRTRTSRDPRDTPAMRQHRRCKDQHPGCLLLFRMGDFYELFDEDAVIASKALELTLTQRTTGIPMAGVPHHAVETYLRRLIEQGHRVAVCEQLQDPAAATGVVDRGVTRVITPGTLVEESLLDAGRANHLVAVSLQDEAVHLAVAELSTGCFELVTTTPDRLPDELARIGAAELLHAEDDQTRIASLLGATHAAARTARPPWTFAPLEAGTLLRTHFGVASLAGFGLGDDEPGLGPAGALLRYLQETQGGGEETTSRLGHLQPPHRDPGNEHVVLDATTLRSLEIERTMHDGAVEGSLLSVLPTARSPMGRRLLRRWLCWPLRDGARIRRRHDAVDALVADRERARRLQAILEGVLDVARIAARASMRRLTPRDAVALGRSLGTIESMADALAEQVALEQDHQAMLKSATALHPLGERLARSCVEDPPAHLRDGGLFRDGVDAELDAARALERDGSAWLRDYQVQLAESSGIPSLKVGWNRVFGYYIEITHAHSERVPIEFTRRQTLKNAERYVTPELKEFEDRVVTAKARALRREQALFEDLVDAIVEATRDLQRFGDAIARIDVLACFAEVAVARGHVRPELVEAPVLDIRGGRHPVLEVLLADRFVPNDCALGGTSGNADTLALITGPNMAGKSTAIRQAALIVLMAHAGAWVPADAARIGLVDRIFTRIGASDELHAGRSTFMVEMTEMAGILHHATARSLVILDEIGRGTGTLDGLSLGWAIAEALADRGCRTLFATHYHELTVLADERPAVVNLHVAVREWGDEIVFLYQLRPGSTDRSYGLHVAKLAGVPPTVIERARGLLETLAVQTESPQVVAHRRPTPPAEQMPLFTAPGPHPALEALRDLDLEAMTPMDAFDALRRLRDRARD